MFCIYVPALDSYKKMKTNDWIVSPEGRIGSQRNSNNWVLQV